MYILALYYYDCNIFCCHVKILYTCNYFLLLIYIGIALNLSPTIEVTLSYFMRKCTEMSLFQHICRNGHKFSCIWIDYTHLSLWYIIPSSSQWLAVNGEMRGCLYLAFVCHPNSAHWHCSLCTIYIFIAKCFILCTFLHWNRVSGKFQIAIGAKCLFWVSRLQCLHSCTIVA